VGVVGGALPGHVALQQREDVALRALHVGLVEGVNAEVAGQQRRHQVPVHHVARQVVLSLSFEHWDEATTILAGRLSDELLQPERPTRGDGVGTESEERLAAHGHSSEVVGVIGGPHAQFVAEKARRQLSTQFVDGPAGVERGDETEGGEAREPAPGLGVALEDHGAERVAELLERRAGIGDHHQVLGGEAAREGVGQQRLGFDGAARLRRGDDVDAGELGRRDGVGVRSVDHAQLPVGATFGVKSGRRGRAAHPQQQRALVAAREQRRDVVEPRVEVVLGVTEPSNRVGGRLADEQRGVTRQ
jgi:hypothetical protein